LRWGVIQHTFDGSDSSKRGACNLVWVRIDGNTKLGLDAVTGGAGEVHDRADKDIIVGDDHVATANPRMGIAVESQQKPNFQFPVDGDISGCLDHVPGVGI
jgi:hypothetical protein